MEEQLISRRLGVDWDKVKSILPQLGAYLLTCWPVVSFTDWFVKRRGLSSTYPELVLVLFLAALPSVLMYLYAQDSISKNGLSAKQRGLLWLNAALLVAILLFGVKSSSPAQQEMESVMLLQPEGDTVQVDVMAREYVSVIPVFPAEPQSQQTPFETKWLGYGFPEVVSYAFNLNPHLTGEPQWAFRNNLESQTTAEKLEFCASAKANLFIDGIYDRVGEHFVITPRVRSGETGEVIAEQKFSSADEFVLLDSIVSFVTKNVQLNKMEQSRTQNIGVQEAMTDNPSALRCYLYGRGAYDLDSLLHSADLDSAFALSNYLAGRLIEAHVGDISRRNRYQDNAVRFRKRMPQINQNWVLVQSQLYKENFEQAAKLLENQTKLEPHSKLGYVSRLRVLLRTEKFDELAAVSKEMIERFSTDLLEETAMIHLSYAAGPAAAQQAISNKIAVVAERPTLLYLQISLSILNNDKANAKEQLADFESKYPEREHWIGVLRKAVEYCDQWNGELLQQFVHDTFDIEGKGFSSTCKNGILYRFSEIGRPSLVVPFGPDDFYNLSYTDRITARYVRDAQGELYGVHERSVIQRQDRRTDFDYCYLKVSPALNEVRETITLGRLEEAGSILSEVSPLFEGRRDYENFKAICSYAEQVNSDKRAQHYNSFDGHESVGRAYQAAQDHLMVNDPLLPSYDLRWTSDSTLASLRFPFIHMAVEQQGDSVRLERIEVEQLLE